MEGYGYGPNGLENAWIAHALMYSAGALPAMTLESRMKDSWENFGPHGEENRTHPTKMTYARHKLGLAPKVAYEDLGKYVKKGE